MSLKVELKPGERLIVGTAVITNSDQRTRLLIDGNLPILREKDILTFEEANTTAKLIYLAVQLMYLEGTFQSSGSDYVRLVDAFAKLHPESRPLLQEISDLIVSSDLYRALKAARKLEAYESSSPTA